MDILLTLLPFAIIASFTPGPNNILVMARGINYGFWATVPYQLGAGLACVVIIGGIIALGAQVEPYIPWVRAGMKYVGCAYMLWLAYVVAFAKPQPTAAGADPAAVGRASEGAGWVAGFVLQFVNPKFYLYTLTLAAVIIPGVQGDWKTIVLYTVFFAVLGVSGMLTWAVAGVVLQSFLQRWKRVTNAVMGLALVWCAWSLLE